MSMVWLAMAGGLDFQRVGGLQISCQVVSFQQPNLDFQPNKLINILVCRGVRPQNWQNCRNSGFFQDEDPSTQIGTRQGEKPAL